MKSIIIVLALAFSAIVLGQSPYVVIEPVVSVNEFTGEVRCQMYVTNSIGDYSGIYLEVSDGEILVYLIRHARHVGGLTFSSEYTTFATAYLRFSDNNIQHYSNLSGFSWDVGGGIFYDFVNFWQAHVAVRVVQQILAHNSDLRVRFEERDLRADFTINHAVIQELARGFGEVCLPLVEEG